MQTEKDRQLVVIGNGMVGHRFLEAAAEVGLMRSCRVVVLSEAFVYDRVNLSKLFAGKSADDLSLVEPDSYGKLGVHVALGVTAVRVNRDARRVETSTGELLPYDELVLATGSYPFVPQVPGRDLHGCFVYRTMSSLLPSARPPPVRGAGVVMGRGLLGLEAANALSSLGLETHVVELSPRLMPLQVDDVGSGMLRSRIEALGITYTPENRRERFSRTRTAPSVTSGFRTARVSKRTRRVTCPPASVPVTSSPATPGSRSDRARRRRVDDACRHARPMQSSRSANARSSRGRMHGLGRARVRMAEIAAKMLAGEDG